ncbi:MAG: hypothetical protein ACI9OJ_001129, partial [Myxococcota bacterium]
MGSCAGSAARSPNMRAHIPIAAYIEPGNGDAMSGGDVVERSDV